LLQYLVIKFHTQFSVPSTTSVVFIICSSHCISYVLDRSGSKQTREAVLR